LRFAGVVIVFGLVSSVIGAVQLGGNVADVLSSTLAESLILVPAMIPGGLLYLAFLRHLRFSNRPILRRLIMVAASPLVVALPWILLVGEIRDEPLLILYLFGIPITCGLVARLTFPDDGAAKVYP
jgi:predicted neutral ceramidase superfamily lipid hydrolase